MYSVNLVLKQGLSCVCRGFVSRPDRGSCLTLQRSQFLHWPLQETAQRTLAETKIHPCILMDKEGKSTLKHRVCFRQVGLRLH